MAKQINPTRMELTRLKRRLKTASRGHKLLKDKQNGMTKKFMEQIRLNRKLRETVESELAAAARQFRSASSAMGEKELAEALLLPAGEIGVTGGAGNIMSVQVPVLHADGSLAGSLPYGFADTSYELDAATIYTILENEIAPAYYDIDKKTGISSTWVGYIKNTIAKVASNFTTNRMLTDYCDQYYYPQAKRAAEVESDDFRLARKISAWKKKLRREWKNIEVISQTQPDASYTLSMRNSLKVEVVLNIGDLSPEDIGVEILFATMDSKQRLHIQERYEYKVVDFNDGVATYQTEIVPDKTGMYQVAARMFAKNPLMPHRQDFELVKWL